MGAFLTPEMDRRFAYPLMFGASRFATYQSESGVSLFHSTFTGQRGAKFEHPFGGIVHHSYRPE